MRTRIYIFYVLYLHSAGLCSVFVFFAILVANI